jgi:hypothetical protein
VGHFFGLSFAQHFSAAGRIARGAGALAAACRPVIVACEVGDNKARELFGYTSQDGAIWNPPMGFSSKEHLTLSRRELLGRAASAASLLLTSPTVLSQANEPHAAVEVDETSSDDLKPLDAIPAVLDALKRFPLVALAERHLLQEWHDFTTALLFHPALPTQLTDIVVEFGNALHQDTADRFVLEGKPVADTELQKIWRHTIGGNVLWDAPVYAQFFRSVRAVNALRQPKHRLRVLLGDPPFDHRKLRGIDDKKYFQSMQAERDAHYADVVEREVLKKERRALLIAGSAHLLCGIHLHDHVDELNAASHLAQRSADLVFVIDPLILPPDPQDALTRRVQTSVALWPHPAIALLSGTWLAGRIDGVGAALDQFLGASCHEGGEQALWRSGRCRAVPGAGRAVNGVSDRPRDLPLGRLSQGVTAAQSNCNGPGSAHRLGGRRPPPGRSPSELVHPMALVTVPRWVARHGADGGGDRLPRVR